MIYLQRFVKVDVWMMFTNSIVYFTFDKGCVSSLWLKIADTQLHDNSRYALKTYAGFSELKSNENIVEKPLRKSRGKYTFWSRKRCILHPRKTTFFPRRIPTGVIFMWLLGGNDSVNTGAYHVTEITWKVHKRNYPRFQFVKRRTILTPKQQWRLLNLAVSSQTRCSTRLKKYVILTDSLVWKQNSTWHRKHIWNKCCTKNGSKRLRPVFTYSLENHTLHRLQMWTFCAVIGTTSFYTPYYSIISSTYWWLQRSCGTTRRGNFTCLLLMWINIALKQIFQLTLKKSNLSAT